jgi:hypothetical protein
VSSLSRGTCGAKPPRVVSVPYIRSNRPEPQGGDGVTQFGCALSELNIDIICANSAPAKGRVERANSTLQDRLVKELRLQGIFTWQSSATACRCPARPAQVDE